MRQFLLLLSVLNFFQATIGRAGIEPPSGALNGYNLNRGTKLSLPVSKKPMVYIFLSAKCPCSNSHLLHIDQLTKQFPQFQFVGINSNKDESTEMAQSYFSAAKIQFPVLRDTDSILANRFAALKTPHAYIVSTAGEVLYQGGVSNSTDLNHAKNFYLRDALTEISQKKSVSNNNTRTLGCYITR